MSKDCARATPATRSKEPHPTGMMPTLGLLAISVAVAVPGYAQTQSETEESAVLDTITVEGARETPDNSYRGESGSSVKMTAPLLDTPRTVQVITQRQIEERGASSLYDVLRTTPGGTLGTGEGGNPMGDRPFIRGYEASTEMMVDGMRSLARTSYEAFNVEQIELVKGPGGAYSGRGGVGGSLNMVSKTARIDDPFNHSSLSFGSDSQFRAALDSNFNLGNNVAARVNLFAQDAEVPGRGGIKDDKLGFAASVVGNLTDRTKLSFGIYHSESDSTPDFGVPMANQAYIDATGDTSFGPGTQAAPYMPIGSVNHGQFFGLHNRDFREVTNQNATLRLDHEFTPSFRMTNQLTYIGSEQAYVVTRPTFEATDGGVLQRGQRPGQRDSEAWAFSTNFSGEAFTGGIEHDYAFGFELSKERLRSGTISGWLPSGDAAFNTPDWMNPDPNVPVDMSGLTYGPLGLPTVTKSASIYAFNTMKFNEQWQANFGVRFEHFDVDQRSGATPLRRKDDIWS